MLERGKFSGLEKRGVESVENAAEITRDPASNIGHADSLEDCQRRPATQLAFVAPARPPSPRGRFNPIFAWRAVGAVFGACIVGGAESMASAETTPDLVYQARPVVESDDVSALNELFSVWGIGNASKVIEEAVIIDEPEIRIFVTPMPGADNEHRCVFVDSELFGVSTVGCAKSPWPIVRDGPVSELGFPLALQNRLGVDSNDTAFIMFAEGKIRIWLNEESPSPER